MTQFLKRFHLVKLFTASSLGLLLNCTTLPGIAQTANTVSPKPDVRTELDLVTKYTKALTTILKLTPSQESRLNEVNEELIRQINSLSKQSKTSLSFQQAVMEADKIRVNKYKSILDAAQFKKYSEHVELTGLSAYHAEEGVPKRRDSVRTGKTDSLNSIKKDTTKRPKKNLLKMP